MPDLIYGPQTEAVLALVERAQALTGDEITALGTAWEAVRDKARDAAWAAADAAQAAAGAAAGAAWNVTGADGGAAWAAAWDTARHADWSVTRAARAAVVDAALALATRGELAPKHYDDLTRSWARIVGPAHPDDASRD